MAAPRVRFAPSPTGYFHVGSGRAALFNWLFARQQHGVFVLRIEDTDAERNRDEYVEGIERAMRWLGLEWDEGPFFQSRRAGLYEAAIAKLLADGRAYACDCTTEAVQTRAGGAASLPATTASAVTAGSIPASGGPSASVHRTTERRPSSTSYGDAPGSRTLTSRTS